MFNVHIEMPSGCVSRGYDRNDEEKAQKTFDQVATQIQSWPDFAAAVVLSDELGPVKRADISNGPYECLATLWER